MKQPVVVIGIGEMGGVFTRGFLRTDHPVYPVSRQTDINYVAKAIPNPLLVLVAVGENDLHSVLRTIPVAWRDKIGLLQNELLPRDWLEHKIESPTVIAVWFEKKKGQDFKVLVPSPVFGPNAPLIESALESLDIPCWELTDKAELDFELVRKNVYILTTNISGLVGGGTVEADEAYIRESILNPTARVVAGYQPLMPTYQGQLNEEGITQLITHAARIQLHDVPLQDQHRPLHLSEPVTSFRQRSLIVQHPIDDLTGNDAENREHRKHHQDLNQRKALGSCSR